MSNRRLSISAALTLLFAAVLSFGGPVAIHLMGDHFVLAPETSCCEPPPQSPTLPAENEHESENEDCPECDLLTSLTLADTGASADLISAPALAVSVTSTNESPALAADHAPRTTRGPPAA